MESIMDTVEFSEAELMVLSKAKRTWGRYIPQRQYGIGRRGDLKETDGLATCIRVAVVGTYPHPNALGYDRFLAHVDDMEDDALGDFLDAIRLAQRRGISNLRAVIIVPKPEDEKRDEDDEVDEDNDGGGTDTARRVEIEDLILSVVAERNVRVEEHCSTVPYYLEILPDKTIDFGPDEYQEESEEEEHTNPVQGD